MFIANITVKIMELQKPRQTLRLQQLILDQIQTDHQTHTGLRLENRQWGNGLTVYQNTTVYYPIPVIGIAAIIPYSYPQDGGVILTAYNSNTVSTILAAHDVNGNKVTANASFLLVGMV